MIEMPVNKEVTVMTDDIRDLAVAYNAYHEIIDKDDRELRTRANLNSLMVWGRILKRAQRQLGIFLAEEDRIDYWISFAERETAKIDHIEQEGAHGVY
jgi:hypothetical protein